MLSCVAMMEQDGHQNGAKQKREKTQVDQHTLELRTDICVIVMSGDSGGEDECAQLQNVEPQALQEIMASISVRLLHLVLTAYSAAGVLTEHTGLVLSGTSSHKQNCDFLNYPAPFTSGTDGLGFDVDAG